MLLSIFAISLGASLGALLRWALSLMLNPVFPTVPMGTLAANLIGGYLVGVAAAFFAQYPNLPPEWRLLAVTGFLGGLTTFSTFSAEVVGLIRNGQLLWALGTAGLHLFGSLIMTGLGIVTLNLLLKR
ncbi:MAG: fluoride efflux transporter CrcB [Burkholderiales bacterium]|nr:fluoride efflux transporter CrcB [Burkholderiales bacterium]